MTLSRILLTLAIIMPAVISAQTRTEKYYLDSIGQVCYSSSAKQISYHIYNDSLAESGIIQITDLDGRILSEGEYSDIPQWKRDGYSKNFRYDGSIKYLAYFKNDKLHGELSTFYVSGQIKRRDIYENGNLVSGNCYTSSGLDTSYYDYEISPRFKGGDEERIKFLIKNIKYPKAASRDGIQGMVALSFVIEKDGTLSNIRIIKSVHPLLDDEALRVMRLMPAWIPGKQDGENVRVQFNMPIKFTI
jgi:TonB family protein